MIVRKPRAVATALRMDDFLVGMRGSGECLPRCKRGCAANRVTVRGRIWIRREPDHPANCSTARHFSEGVKVDGNGQKSVIRVTLQVRLSRSVSHRLGTSAMALQDTFRIDLPESGSKLWKQLHVLNLSLWLTCP